MNDPIWGWLPPPVDPWKGRIYRHNRLLDERYEPKHAATRKTSEGTKR